MIIHNKSEIYLDANATTQVLPAAAIAARDAMEDLYGNPSSSHISGLRARNILESTRELARKVLGAEKGQVVFTSGATEAIQMGVFSALCAAKAKLTGDGQQKKRTLMFGSTEHKAVPQAIKHWNRLLSVNAEILEIPVDQRGRLDLDFIEQHAADADLICTMAVNNETGVVADLAAIESKIRAVNPDCVWLVDCVQAIGKLNLDLSSTTIDYAAFSGHKIFAPKGIGVLYARESANLIPMMAGGGQEQGARGGTENLPGVAAIGAVLNQLVASPNCLFAEPKVLAKYRDQFVDALRDAFPTIVFNTSIEDCVPTTINFAVKGFPSKELMDLFDAADIRVSSGSACGSEAVSSYVLDAMGIEPWQSFGAIRLSFSALASQSDIDSACQRIRAAGIALGEHCLIAASDTMAMSGQKLNGLIQLKNKSNCTWLWMDAESKRCIVIDPFEEMAERVETLVRCQKSKVIAILDSHAHVDHDSCRKELLGAMSAEAEESATTSDLLGWPEQVDGTCTLGDGSQAEWIKVADDLVIAKTDLPGHTLIGVAYFVGRLTGDQLLPENVKFVFSGDMVLMGGIGRTDFPCSSVEKMYESLQRLPKLIDSSTLICPTHDYNNEFATTLATELSSNEFLNSIVDAVVPITKEQFIEVKPGIDSKIGDDSNSELVCGLIRNDEPGANDIRLSKEELAKLIDSQCLIIDVREPHEFAFEQSWEELGFKEKPMNIPLTRLSNFLPELIQGETGTTLDQEIVFVCRSGRRSSAAASVARRLGLHNAKHICGGLALNTQRNVKAKSNLEYII